MSQAGTQTSSQLSRYGAISRVLPGLAASARSFFVLSNAGSVAPWLGNFLNDFPSDGGGVPRVYSSIATALANCTANRGDVIYVLPGHAENVTNATDLNVNVAGVRVVGMGNGNGRPVITMNTATTSVITFSAANTSLENVIVDGTGFDAIAKIFSIVVAGVSLIGNKFITGGATNQSTLGVLTSALCTDLTIQGNTFYATADAGTTAAIELVGGSNIFILSNTFIGGYSSAVGAITNITTDCVNVVVKDNLINNLTASSTKAMTFTSGTTGQIANNRMQILSGTAPITGAAMSWVGGNYYAAAIATAGTLI